MRLRSALSALTLPFSLVLLAHGCDGCEDIPPIENLCAFIEDPANCYRSFHLDVGAQCGAAGVNQAPVGTFLARDALDICVLNEGGQVLFDPPLDLTKFPLGQFKSGPDGTTIPPEPQGFKFIRANGEECGAGTYTTEFDFSLSINGCPPDAGAPPPPPTGSGGGGSSGSGGSGGGTPAAFGCNRGGDEDSSVIVGGTFKMAVSGELLDTTCPSGETHHFDQLTTAKCPKSAALVPRAEVFSGAGFIDDPNSTSDRGYVFLRVYFPPEGAADDQSLEGKAPDVVEYFYCFIPPAPRPCQDGLKNGAETDVDCGGDEDPVLPGCPVRCIDGQGCFDGDDCLTGVCAPDPVGIKKCVGPEN